MMAIVSNPHEFLTRLVKALGMSGNQPIRRVVLDVEIDSAPMVYIEQFVDKDSMVDVVDLLSGERDRREHATLNVSHVGGKASVSVRRGCGYCRVGEGEEHAADCPARQPFADFKGTLDKIMGVKDSPATATVRGVPDQYCPACGAGPNGDGSFRVQKGYPFADPCKECERRSLARMEELGRRAAKEQEERILQMIKSERRPDSSKIEEIAEKIESGEPNGSPEDGIHKACKVPAGWLHAPTCPVPAMKRADALPPPDVAAAVGKRMVSEKTKQIVDTLCEVAASGDCPPCGVPPGLHLPGCWMDQARAAKQDDIDVPMIVVDGGQR